jgi:hypothetical protein
MGMHKRSDDLQFSQEVQYLTRINEAQSDRKGATSSNFSGNLKDLDKDLSTQPQNYVYSIRLSSENWAESFAIPKSDGMKSYIGITYFSKGKANNSSTLSTICESENPTKLVVKDAIKHAIVDGFPLCPNAYTSVLRFAKS